MDNGSTTAYWVAAAIILVLLVIGVALWYSASTASPGVPNTGPGQTTGTDQNTQGTTPAGAATSSTPRDGTVR